MDMSREKEYWAEFTHLVFVAIALAFFVTSFILLGRIVLAKLPVPGLAQTFAAA